MGTTPHSSSSQPSSSLTSGDLAFIDAAIAMQRAASQMDTSARGKGAVVSFEPALFIGIIQIVAAAVEVATFVYHAVKGRIPTFNLARTPGEVGQNASLSQLIEARNQLAKSLGESSVLK